MKQRHRTEIYPPRVDIGVPGIRCHNRSAAHPQSSETFTDTLSAKGAQDYGVKNRTLEPLEATVTSEAQAPKRRCTKAKTTTTTARDANGGERIYLDSVTSIIGSRTTCAPKTHHPNPHHGIPSPPLPSNRDGQYPPPSTDNPKATMRAGDALDSPEHRSSDPAPACRTPHPRSAPPTADRLRHGPPAERAGCRGG